MHKRTLSIMAAAMFAPLAAASAHAPREGLEAKPAAGQDARAPDAPAAFVRVAGGEIPAAPAAAGPVRVTLGPLVIETPWARATPGGATAGAGYLTIANTGTAPDTLLGGSLEIADHVEVHEMTMTDGVMKMRQLPEGLVIPPGETVKLESGGLHVMFIGLKKGLKAGEPVTVKLNFKSAGTVEVDFAVAPIGAPAPESGRASPQ